MRVLFRVAAGPRAGFGHLVRARSLARALGIARPTVSVRGPAVARRSAARLGMRPVDGSVQRVLAEVAPGVLIIDDPSTVAGRAWRVAATRRGIPVASIHDLGKAFCGADLSIDGSLVPPRRRPDRGRLLSGSRYAVIDPQVRGLRRATRRLNRVLIALGGGPRASVAVRLATALRRARPDLQIRIAGGFASPTSRQRNGITNLGPQDGLALEFARCTAAITGGGVSLYEAAVLGTPAVVWPVVRAQWPTALGAERHGLAQAVLPGPARVERAVAAVLEALNDTSHGPHRKRHRALDGRGADRAARAISRLARGKRGIRP